MDEEAEEREFLADLKARSGRDLAGWMAAIAEQSFADKNDTIDWLRRQGFPFARASWLERIHSNGGRPIYLHGAVSVAAQPMAAPAAKPPAERPPRPPAEPKSKLPAAAEAIPLPTAGDVAQREKLLAVAKGYRPLYLLIEQQIHAAMPDVHITPMPGFFSLGAPAEFAVLVPMANEVRLGLDLGERGHDAQLQKPKIKGASAAITHMLIITDARQVNADLIGLVTAARARALTT